MKRHLRDQMYLVVSFLIAVCFCCAPPAHAAPTHAASDSCVAAPAGLVAWWSGDNTASGTSTVRQKVQGNSAYAPGKVGAAFVFNSQTSYLKIPANAKLDVGKGSGFSLELWIKPATDEPHHPLLEWHDAQTGVGVHLWIHDIAGRLWANIRDTEGNDHVVASGAGVILPRVWQHVALAYDKSGSASLYRNGVLMARQDIGSFVPQTSYDLYLGVRYSERDRYYLGLMDEISVYDRALSGREFQDIYGAGSAGKCIPTE